MLRQSEGFRECIGEIHYIKLSVVCVCVCVCVSVCVGDVHMCEHDRKQPERQEDGKGKSLRVQPSVKIWHWTIRLIHSHLVTVTLQPIK